MTEEQHHFSPKEVASAIGVSESSLKRWADAGRLQVIRTPGGHRRITLGEAARFVRESDFSLARPDLLGLPTADLVTMPSDDGEALFERMMAGDAHVVAAWVVDAYLRGRSVAEICDDGLREAMRRIGEVWAHDERGIFLEHRATDQVVSALHWLLRLIGEPREDASRPVALGGSPSEDPYVIPSLMAMCVTCDAGYRGINLGADLPLKSLSDAAVFFKAKLVWLSLSATRPKGPGIDAIHTLAHELAEIGAALVIGGRGAARPKQPRPSNLHFCATMTELAGFAQALRDTPGPTGPTI